MYPHLGVSDSRLLHAKEFVCQVGLGFLTEKCRSIILGKKRIHWHLRLVHHKIVLLNHLWLGYPEDSSPIILLMVPPIRTFRHLKVIVTGVEDILLLGSLIGFLQT